MWMDELIRFKGNDVGNLYFIVFNFLYEKNIFRIKYYLYLGIMFYIYYLGNFE